eukprot:CAMPEP_0175088404 /NCGR_PEP_ID=MMETSP0086_2-20121207/233_1 /TAXON_ID=136419 /ORGANISM="Unknown Unknown, Strain D1" /LENGTH=351 /DNA_ID=CAMNT_0016360841 /DNA_START=263 /DNA_END=1318 /DNA_ORIENTATION=+
MKVMIRLLPIVFSVLFSKSLTFVAFGSIPVSLTLTVKSAAPIFSVILDKLVYGRLPNTKACVALIPIAVGVTLSSITEVKFALWGLVAAAASTLMVVAQTMYTKSCMEKISTLDPLLLHLYTSTAAIVVMVPYVLYSVCTLYLSQAVAPETGTKLDKLGLMDTSVILSAFQPFLVLSLGVGCVYVQNMSSLAFLDATSTISHQVATTCNKFTVIVASILYFHEPVSTANVGGFVVALVGFFLYTHANNNHVPQHKTVSGECDGSSMSDVELGCAHSFSVLKQQRNNLDGTPEPRSAGGIGNEQQKLVTPSPSAMLIAMQKRVEQAKPTYATVTVQLNTSRLSSERCSTSGP